MAHQVGFEKTKDEKVQTQKKESKEVKVLMGVFFDGTGNSLRNIDIYDNFKKGESGYWFTGLKSWSDSYTTDYSNVAHKYHAYRHTLKPENGFYVRRVYMTGIGTANRSIYLDTKGLDDETQSKYQAKVKGNKGKEYSNVGVNDADENLKEGNDFDNIPSGVARGIGDTGILGKVKIGCESIYKDLGFVLDLASEEHEITNVNLYLDVYGFSRGAAAARCFVNHIYCYKDESGGSGVSRGTDSGFEDEHSLSYWMDPDKKGYEMMDGTRIEYDKINIKVRFLGLYDTVSSYGTSAKYMGGFDDDVDELGLDYLESSKPVDIGNVLQLCAGDEYRECFSLTNVDSYSTALGSKCAQYIFPGAHSDVGGGYKIKEVQDRDYKNWLGSVLYNAGFKSVSVLEREGWFLPNQTQREVVNNYCIIPLTFMLDYLDKCDYSEVPKSLKYIDNTVIENLVAQKINSKNNESLKAIKDDLLNYAKRDKLKPNGLYKFSNEEVQNGSSKQRIDTILPCYKPEDFKLIKAIRNKYLHLSSKDSTGNEARVQNLRKVITG